MLPREVQDLPALASACYNACSMEQANEQLARIERPLAAGPYRLQHVNHRFVCLRSPSAVVICFHGSEAATDNGRQPSEGTLLDWRNNIDVALVAAPDITRHGRLHRGFTRIFQEAVQGINRVLAMSEGDGTAIWLTGHSLGGALAQLCGLHLAQNHPAMAKRTSIYTMGSPRVGDSVSAMNLAAGIAFIMHARMPLDPITNSPPVVLGYAENAGERQTLGTPSRRQGLLSSLMDTARGLWEHRICAYQRALERVA